MENFNTQEIARTARAFDAEQLSQEIFGRWDPVVMSWKASNFEVYTRQVYRNAGGDVLVVGADDVPEGLDRTQVHTEQIMAAARVDGLKHKGWIAIVLNYTDLFDLYLLEGSSVKDAKIKSVRKNIFIGDLIDRIDEEVEYTGADYRNDVVRRLNVATTRFDEEGK